LAKSHDCLIQMGGSDQWGNIVAGIDLVRRTLGKQAFGITFPLITTAGGIKMGKTHKGAVWLDAQRFSPYEYYQFWVNCDDADVIRFLSLFTFLPMEEINGMGQLQGADLNKAKTILAYEATCICHGKQEADKALQASAAMFGALDIPSDLLSSSGILRKIGSDAKDQSVPSSSYSKDQILGNTLAVDFFTMTGLCASKSDARRLIKQGGAYIDGKRVIAFDQTYSKEDINGNEILLRAGKKKYHKIILN
jgi:tyrosyl-tRNA synthetase